MFVLYTRNFAENVDFWLKLIPKVETKNGKQYVTFSDIKLDFTPTKYVNSMCHIIQIHPYTCIECGRLLSTEQKFINH